MEAVERKKKFKTESVRFCAMLVACCLYAFGTDCFLIHNSIVGGGASGIATIIYLITDRKVSIGLMTVVINGDAIYEYLGLTGKKKTSADGLFTLETVACLGACGLAPVMTIDGEVHAKMTPEAALALLEEIRGKEAAAQ